MCTCEYLPFAFDYRAMMLITYSFFVETAGKTLEELKEIFEAKNPRKESTKKVKVRVDENGHVLGVGDEVETRV